MKESKTIKNKSLKGLNKKIAKDDSFINDLINVIDDATNISSDLYDALKEMPQDINFTLYNVYEPYIFRYANIKEDKKTKEDKENEKKWNEELKTLTFNELIDKYKEEADAWLEKYNKKRSYVHKSANALLSIDNNELINSIVLKENKVLYSVKGGYIQLDLNAYEDINYTEVFTIKNIIANIKENRFTTNTIADILYNTRYNEIYKDDKKYRVKITDKDRLRINKYIYFGLTNNFIFHNNKSNININGYFLRLVYKGDIDLKKCSDNVQFEKPKNVFAEYKQYYLDNLPIEKENKETLLLLQYNKDIAGSKNSKHKGEMARKLENSLNICRSIGKSPYYLDVKEIYSIFEATSRKNKADAIASTINILMNNKDYKPLKKFNIISVNKIKGGSRGAIKQLEINFK